MDSLSRRLSDLDQIALLLATGLGQVVEVIPPATAADVVSFKVALREPDKASALLGSFASGALDTNLKDFTDALRRVRRMVRDARAGGPYERR